MKELLFLFISVISVNNYLIGQIQYPGESPGQAVIKTLRGNLVALENNVIRMEFINDGKKINIRDFKDKKTNEQLNPATAALFELTLPDSSVITSNEFTLVKSPVASTEAIIKIQKAVRVEYAL